MDDRVRRSAPALVAALTFVTVAVGLARRDRSRARRRDEARATRRRDFHRAALPPTLPVVPGFCIAASYVAGTSEAQTGGDWYDAFRLIDGRLVITVGDVAGGGLGAAVTMGALRQAMRGAAQIHPDPLAILDAADRLLRDDAFDREATAFVAVIDPVTLACQFASAGHPAPKVRRPSGHVEDLHAPGLRLGFRERATSSLGDVELEPGAVLALFTDGLLETSADARSGDLRVHAALSRPDVAEAENAARALERAVLERSPHGDVAVITVRVRSRRSGVEDGLWTWSFHVDDVVSARETRVGFTAHLRALGADDGELRDAEVVLAELLGNVVRYARGPVDVALDTRGALPVLSVLDRGPGFTHASHLPSDLMSESGRGLFIVNSLCAEFTATRRRDRGTHVRAVLAVDRTRPVRRGSGFLDVLPGIAS